MLRSAVITFIWLVSWLAIAVWLGGCALHQSAALDQDDVLQQSDEPFVQSPRFCINAPNFTNACKVIPEPA